MASTRPLAHAVGYALCLILRLSVWMAQLSETNVGQLGTQIEGEENRTIQRVMRVDVDALFLTRVEKK